MAPVPRDAVEHDLPRAARRARRAARGSAPRDRRCVCGDSRPATRSSRARRGPVLRASDAVARRPSASSRSRARCQARLQQARLQARAQRARRMPCARVLASSARPRRCSTASKRWRGSASRSSRRGRPRAAARRCARMPSSARRAAIARRRPSLPVCSISSRVLRHGPFGGLGRRRRARVGGEVDQRPVGLVADRGDQRDGALGRRAHHDLLVEAPQVLEAAAAARHDQHVGPRHRGRPARSALKPRMAAATSAAQVSPCTRTGQTSTRAGKRSSKPCSMSRITAPVGEVTMPIDARQERQRALARLVEQALGGELLLALLQQRHQRADAGRLQRVDDDLVLGRAGIGRDAAGGDDLQPFLRLELQAARRCCARSRPRSWPCRPSARNSSGPRHARRGSPRSRRAGARSRSASSSVRLMAERQLGHREFRRIGARPRLAGGAGGFGQRSSPGFVRRRIR